MRSRSLTILLVACVLLAGCGADESMPTTTQQSAFEGNASAITFPDGASQQLILDGETVARGHVRGLATGNYAITVFENISIRDRRLQSQRTVRSRLDAEELLLTTEVPGNEESRVRYLDNTSLYSRTTANGTTTYDFETGNISFGLFHVQRTFGRTLILLLDLGTFEAVGTVTRDGRTLIEYNMTEAALASRRGNTTVDRAEGYVLLGQDGIVYDARIDIRGRERGSEFIANIEYAVTARENVSITRPDWLDRARNASASNETTPSNATGGQSSTSSSG